MKNKLSQTGKLKKRLLFQIPNPFDNYQPEKDAWTMRVEKLENKIIETRKTIDEMLKELKRTIDLKPSKLDTGNKNKPSNKKS